EMLEDARMAAISPYGTNVSTWARAALTPTVCLEEATTEFLARAFKHGDLRADGSLVSIFVKGLGEV
ncbi:9597_t:CDS:2, partial [Acaulospora colombiana]